MPIVGSSPDLTALHRAITGLGPLPPLEPDRYALAHAAWEASSDQRGLLQTWLPAELAPRLAAARPGPYSAGRPLRVIGVGVGDGSVDARLAAALAAGGRPVHYTGVEPHELSAAAFAARLGGLALPGLEVRTVAAGFDALEGGADDAAPVDLVHFVHSLYYQPDLGAALDHALSMLRPGGLLVSCTAPLEPLCVLTDLLTPRDGHPHWFAGDVRAELLARRLDVSTAPLDGVLDLTALRTDPDGEGALLLDFLVTARTAGLPGAVTVALREYLSALALPTADGRWLVPHPLDLVIARVP